MSSKYDISQYDNDQRWPGATCQTWATLWKSTSDLERFYSTQPGISGEHGQDPRSFDQQVQEWNLKKCFFLNNVCT